MPASTARGYPYPVGTDRVMDGDNAIQSLAEAVDTDALITLSVGTSGQTIPAATPTGITWAAATENGCALTKTSGTVWTTTLAGFYLVSAQMRLAGTQTTRGFMDLYAGNRVGRGVCTGDSNVAVTLVTRLNVGETIKADAYAGTATTIGTQVNGTGTWLTVMRLGRNPAATAVP